MTTMLADLDDALDRFRASADTISANLLELEHDPNQKLLEAAALAGESARQWVEAREAITAIWNWLARFTAFLERAAELRVSRKTGLSPGRERALADFLAGASIELSHDQVPLRDRDLLQNRVSTAHCTANELLTLMSEAFARAKTVVVNIGSAWGDLAPRVAAARATVAEITRAAEAIGAVEPDLVELRRRLDLLTETFVTDPLAVTPGDVDQIERETADINGSIESAVRLRDELSAELVRARAALADLQYVVDSVEIADREVRAKILEPAVPKIATFDPRLAADLDAVSVLSAQGSWRAAYTALDRWDAAVASKLQGARECLTAMSEPIEIRNRLRGRLAAYRAKADGLHLAEDRELSDEYDRAEEALYTAPTDLDAAAELVQQYQRALSARDSDRRGLR